jgi:hypothetical protein
MDSIDLTTARPEQTLRWSQALWYAWGWQDAGQTLPEGSGAFAFADAYERRSRDYIEGRTGMMPSMQEAFADWIFGRAL